MTLRSYIFIELLFAEAIRFYILCKYLKDWLENNYIFNNSCRTKWPNKCYLSFKYYVTLLI